MKKHEKKNAPAAHMARTTRTASAQTTRAASAQTAHTASAQTARTASTARNTTDHKDGSGEKRAVRRLPELLIPAGGPRQLRAAVANGADAVYLSGASFNARVNAGNFSDGELEEAVRFAHEYGVRVHVALNTLIRDDEMEEAVRFARRVSGFGADALILQDRGLAAELMKRMPQMTFHLSTQGTAYDLAGVEEARQAGFRRVILSRELSLEEIRSICSSTDAEIEIFVHGAICIAYSGQCHLSCVIGGRSGNRGSCAQPCRLPYELVREDGRIERPGKGGGSYLLSPADMCLVDHLPELAEAGVSSLKIEGRMKSPEYVAVVTRIYRKYLDLLARGTPRKISEEDFYELCSVFNRGGMTDAYLRGESGRSLMSCDVPKHRGVPVGRVISYDRKRGHAVIELSGQLSVGDGIEIRSGENLCGNVVTYLNDRGAMLKTAEAGRRVKVGDLEGKVVPGSTVFKITDRWLQQQAERSFQRIPGTLPADMSVRAEEGGSLILRMTAPLWRHNAEGKNADEKTAERREDREAPQQNYPAAEVEVVSRTALERALKRPAEEADIRRQLEKTGGTPYCLNRLDVRIAGSPMIPASALNALRREASEALTGLRLQRMQRGLQTRQTQQTRQARQTQQARQAHESPGSAASALKSSGGMAESADVPRGYPCRIVLSFYDTEENTEKAKEILRRIGTTNARGAGMPNAHGAEGVNAGERAMVNAGERAMVNADRIKTVDTDKDKEVKMVNTGGSGTAKDVFTADEIILMMPYRSFLKDAESFLAAAESAEKRLKERCGPQTRVHILPALPTVTRGTEPGTLKEDAAKLKQLFKEGRIPAVSVAGGGQLMMFCEKNKEIRLPLTADESLNIFNRFSAAEAFQRGFRRVALSNELTDDQILRLLSDSGGKTAADFEIAVSGRIPVMHTEHCAVGMRDSGGDCSPGEKKYYCRRGKFSLRDRKGASFPVLCDSSVCRMEILSHRPVDRTALIRRLLTDRTLSSVPAMRIYVFDESADRILEQMEALAGLFHSPAAPAGKEE